MNKIHVCRKTTESEMNVTLDFSPLRADYRKYINTSLPFLNHMLEHIAWRGGFNLEADVKLDEFTLTHVIAEDLGIALGKACREYVLNTDGCFGYGDAVGIIDEAKAQSCLSFEERALFVIDYHGAALTEKVEGMDTQDLETFLEGFVQGAMCTLHVDLERGHNGHHIWEAIYRSLGSAIGKVFEINEARKGKTAGVAGKISWTTERDDA